MNSIIFIIDSLNAAMAANLMLKELEGPFEIIIEKKSGVDDTFDLERVVRELYAGFEELKITTLVVDSHYFLASKLPRIKRFYIERSFRKKILLLYNFKKNATYIGQISSSIIISLTNYKRIIVDHGYGEYASRSFFLNLKLGCRIYSFLWQEFKYFIKVLLGIPSLPVHRKEHYSLCRLEGDSCKHLDYRNLEISLSMQSLLFNQFSKFHNPMLILASGPIHSADGLPKYSEEYDPINLRMILRHNPKKTPVLIKFHGILYHMNEFPKTSIVGLLEREGIEACVVDDCLPNYLRGNLPAEILIQCLNISKIVCESSATIYNVSCNQNMLSISDFSRKESNLSSHLFMAQSINRRLKNKINIYLGEL
jgi:hypothetical protein